MRLCLPPLYCISSQSPGVRFMQRLPSILREVMEEEGLQQLPLFAFGASSGGSQVLRLAAIMPEVQVR